MTLTREEILAMEPGRKLDVAVYRYIVCDNWVKNMYSDIEYETSAHYSTDISAAWEVESIFDQDTPLREDYAIELHNVMGLMLHEPTTLNNVYQFAHATPEQRCKAALLAVLNL